MILRVAQLARRLRRDASGVAVTEFALVAAVPARRRAVGLEIANRAIVQMRVSQLAMHIADNASRIGDTSTLEDRKIYESDINDLLRRRATCRAAAASTSTSTAGSIISSLEVVPDTEDQQYIHWQRCMGAKQHVLELRRRGDGLDGACRHGPGGRGSAWPRPAKR